MSFVLGLAHQRVCGSVVMHQSAVVSSSGEDFRISSLVPLFHRISFPNYLKPSTKSRFLQTFLFGRKMFKARHVIKMLGYILKKLASQPCLKLSRRPVSTIKANSQTPHSPFSPNWIRLLSVQVYSINFTGQLISVEWQARILSLFPSAFLRSNQKSGIGPRTHTP